MRRLAFHQMSKASPATGMVPTSTPIARFATIRSSVAEATPRIHATRGNDERKTAGEDTVQAGNQAEDAIKPETDAGAGHDKSLVEEDLEQVHVFDVEEAAEAGPAARGGDFESDFFSGHLRPLCRERLAAVFARMPQFSSDGTMFLVDGGYSSGAERLSVAQDVVGSIPTSRPKNPFTTLHLTCGPRNFSECE